MERHQSDYNLKRYKAHKEWMAQLKSVPCMDCGGKFPPECMDFDHVRGEKAFHISNAHNLSMDRIIAEIEKCDIICSNCHRIRTKKRLT